MLALWASGCSESEAPVATRAPPGPTVRVEVRRLRDELTVRFPAGVVVVAADGQALFEGALPEPARLRRVDAGVELGGHLFATPLRVEPREHPGGAAVRARGPAPGRFVIESADGTALEYPGALEVLPGDDGEQLALVAVAPIDDYLLGVIGSEIPALYPIEAVKAQAVASRTYALHVLREAEARGDSPIFGATDAFQVFRGWPAGQGPHARVVEAVEATSAEVLTYQERLFRAYFHSTCGGRTARGDLIFDEPSIPPLRGAGCGACDDTRFARWEVTLSRQRIESALRSRLGAERPSVDLGALRDVQVSEVAPDGRARYVRIEHERGTLEWRADRFRSEVDRVEPGALRSTFFEILRGPGEAFTVRGRGWGHGVGLCQVGAGGLARSGATYREILGRYYPGGELRRAW